MTPTWVHNATSIPEHWVEKVNQDLDKDVQLRVLEKVPQMSVVGKETEKPRRVIDFCGLNKYKGRQTQSIKSPFMKVSQVYSSGNLTGITPSSLCNGGGRGTVWLLKGAGVWRCLYRPI